MTEAEKALTARLVETVRAYCVEGGALGPMLRALVALDEEHGHDTFGRRGARGESGGRVSGQGSTVEGGGNLPANSGEVEP